MAVHRLLWALGPRFGAKNMHEQNHTLELGFSDSKPRLIHVLKGSLCVLNAKPTDTEVWDLVLCVPVMSFKAFLGSGSHYCKKLGK